MDSFDTNLGVTVHVVAQAAVAKMSGRKQAEDTLDQEIDQRVIDACRRNEAKILEWIAVDPKNLAQFTADPVTALADAQLIEPDIARAMLRYRDGLRTVLQSHQGVEIASLVLRPDR